jgi:hypothetical protein
MLWRPVFAKAPHRGIVAGEQDLGAVPFDPPADLIAGSNRQQPQTDHPPPFEEQGKLHLPRRGLNRRRILRSPHQLTGSGMPISLDLIPRRLAFEGCNS